MRGREKYITCKYAAWDPLDERVDERVGTNLRYIPMRRMYEALKGEDTQHYPQKSWGLLIKPRASFAVLTRPDL